MIALPSRSWSKADSVSRLLWEFTVFTCHHRSVVVVVTGVGLGVCLHTKIPVSGDVILWCSAIHRIEHARRFMRNQAARESQRSLSGNDIEAFFLAGASEHGITVARVEGVTQSEKQQVPM